SGAPASSDPRAVEAGSDRPASGLGAGSVRVITLQPTPPHRGTVRSRGGADLRTCPSARGRRLRPPPVRAHSSRAGRVRMPPRPVQRPPPEERSPGGSLDAGDLADTARSPALLTPSRT